MSAKVQKNPLLPTKVADFFHSAVNGTDSEAFKTRGAYKCILKFFLTVFHARIGHLLHYNNRSQ